MARSLRYLLIFLFTIGSVNAFAQANGAIEGVATDDAQEPVIGAIIEVYSGGIKRLGTVTDVDGNYIIKPLAAGEYNLVAKAEGYKSVTITKISVSNDGTSRVNLNFSQNVIDEVVIEYKKPLINTRGGVNTTFDAKDVTNAPTRDLTKIVATSAGMVNNGRDNTINAGGSRGGNTITMLDGVMIRGGVPNLSNQVVNEIEVELGGLPAKRGDATGAVVSITTRGPSPVYTGGLQLEKSVEGFGHNLANFTISGPMISKKQKSGAKTPIVGFLLNGEAIYDKNRQPSFNGNWVATDATRQQLEARPLVLSPNTVGAPVYNYATEFVTKDQLENVRVMPNAAIFEGRLFGKVDYQLNENMNLTAGVNGTYTKGSALANGGSYNFIMFTPDAIPITTSFEGRGYLRFTQRFSNKTATGPDAKESRIQNAFYSLQGDYTKTYVSTEDPTHGRDIFNYGYLGKFTQNTESRYLYDVDTNTGTRMWQLVSYDAPTSYTFERSELNPILANYTSNFYQLGLLPPTITELRGQRGLANGDQPGSAYGLYRNVGTALNGYSYNNNDQISASANASFDLILGNGKNKKRHAIEFGLYYQQSVNRGYALNSSIGTSNSLWQVMRSSANQHIGLDLANPLYRIGGNTYTKDQVYSPDNPSGTVIAGIFDSLYYNRIAVEANQTYFDKNLRAKLGLPVNGTDIIQVDQLDPSTFSLDMFSADELINSLNGSLVGYQGYDYLGNRLKGQVNFNDYFTAKDANGNFSRNIGAYRPNYIAGYIQDRFTFKDINFNIGLRVDRYDLNTKVLRDPYSLYETYKVGDRSAGDFTARGDIPGNMGDDYVVYVDNNQSSTPTIIGYRNGDEWYNANGQVIQDPSALRAVSGRDPQPYLTNAGKVLISDTTLTDGNAAYDPTRSFTDYKPQTTLSPRIAFQFPISEKSQFYAHYDILVQRPISNVYATPYDYLYFTQVHDGINNPINNPNLKPEKTFDYEFGFSQALSSTSVISIAGTYKERKGWIQKRAYVSAWPQTYFSYDNSGFSTTKGFYLKYDLRRTKNLRMLLNYTLQFVEGTSSAANSGQGMLQTLVASQLPNLRAVMPLEFDSRHIISANVDYRFAQGEGPVIGDKHFLQNAGINLLFTSRSGEPYTRYAQPIAVANTIKGELNGSRLAWHYMLDLRVDKDFTLSFRKQAEGASSTKAPQRSLYLNVYCFINNVLNTRDIIAVDGFTGRPDDDGYLVSPQGILLQSTQTSPSSYYDLYSINQMNPFNLNLPRRINFGLSLNF